MNLPPIDIPLPPLPFEIPVLLHPPVVHFAVALPVILLLVEIINLIMKRRALNVTSTILIILIGVVFFAAFLTGKTDGKEAYPLLSAAGQEELKEHKLLGIYLVYAVGVLLLFKFISMIVKKAWGKIFYLLLLLAFIGMTFLQGKHGGELVYEYGANVKAVSKLEDKIEALEEEIDQLKSSSVKESVKEEKQEEVAKEESIKKEEAKPEPKEEVKSEAPITQEPKETVEQKTETNEVKETSATEQESVKESQQEEQQTSSVPSVTEEQKPAEPEVKEENVEKASENVSEKQEEAPAAALENKEETTKEAETNEANHSEATQSQETTEKTEQSTASSIVESVKEKAKEIKEEIQEKAKEMVSPEADKESVPAAATEANPSAEQPQSAEH